MTQQTRSARRRDPSKVTYDWYINSAAWERRKVAYYSRNARRCRACGTSDNIHLHHHTYKRLGREHDDDLIPLCQAHHDTVHRLHRSAEFKGTLSAATRQVIGGPLHPPRNRKKPPVRVDAMDRKRRRAQKPPPDTPLVEEVEPYPLSPGDRVEIIAESKALSWARGMMGTVRETISPLKSWSVELDGKPGSRMACTLQMVRRADPQQLTNRVR